MPIEAAREIATLLDARMVELPTGHAPHVEATNEFVEALDGFLPRRRID
jgi:pimeloyl-ACP methyl ester carboxylesterase